MVFNLRDGLRVCLSSAEAAEHKQVVGWMCCVVNREWPRLNAEPQSNVVALATKYVDDDVRDRRLVW